MNRKNFFVKNVPIPTASFYHPTENRTHPFPPFKAEGTGHKPCPSLLSLFLFKHKKRETETKQKSLFFVVPDFQKKKERSQKSIGNKGKKKEKAKKRKAESLPGKKKEKNRPWRAVRKEGKSGKSERRKS